MRMLIDADGCPVVAPAVNEANKRGMECIIVCDTAHSINYPGVKTVTVSTGADSADFTLVNLTLQGDVVITQDYGLAAMCLARRARALDQNGREYTPENIDALLLSRHTAAKLRRAGGRLKGHAKRTKQQDEDFLKALIKLLDGQ